MGTGQRYFYKSDNWFCQKCRQRTKGGSLRVSGCTVEALHGYMFILGLNAYHGDSAACLVRDGVLVAAAEEERFRRIKHWAGLPTEAIGWCLREGGIQFGDVDHIAVNRNPKVNNFRRLGFLLTHRPDPRLVLN